MKVVLLCGGKGTRLQSQTAGLPKPLIEIGGRPILWHVMSWYAHFGFREFVLCLGFLGEKIQEYFHDFPQWDLAFADTGLETQTGGRIKAVESLVDARAVGDVFLANYSDGLSDLDLRALIDFHRSHAKIATLTAVRPHSQFGLIELDGERVTRFREKPRTENWINGGFFVFDRRIFDFIEPDAALESDVLSKLASMGELMAYQHTGNWECMDTYKDNAYLNQLWDGGEAFWKIW